MTEKIQKKPYKVIVWPKEGGVIRDIIYAANSEEAIAITKIKYGNDAKFSGWNEEDAERPR